MTNFQKILILKEKGHNIKYHYRPEPLRRLIIDEIDNIIYLITNRDQALASKHLRELMEEEKHD